MKKILVMGSLAYDHLMTFDGEIKNFLLEDIDHLSLSFQTKDEKLFFGGCAGNIAYTSHLLGDAPYVVSVAGNDFDKYETWLKQNNISSKYVCISKTQNTACAYILTDNKHSQLTIFSVGAMQDVSELERFDFSSIPDVDFAVISPGFPYSMLYFAQSCIDKKIPFLMDPGQNITALSGEILISLIDSSKGFIVNEYEGDIAVKLTSMTLFNISKRIPFLIRTLGGEGAEIYKNGEITHVPAVPNLKIEDVTGGGDAFRGGLIHGLVSGESIERSCQMGHVAASFSIEKQGTQEHKFTIEEFTARLKKHYYS